MAEKKAGIALDEWKIPVFVKYLRASGYGYQRCPGVTPGTALLTVTIDESEMDALKQIISTANTEAAEIAARNERLREAAAK